MIETVNFMSCVFYHKEGREKVETRKGGIRGDRERGREESGERERGGT